MREPVLKVEGVHKTYPGKKEGITAVDGISFSLHKGELVGLLGPNGAGKTTMVKMICGLVRPSAGRIEVSGFNPWVERQKALLRISAVLEGNRNIYWPLTVRENLEFFAALKGARPRSLRQRMDDLIHMLNLGDKIHVTARSLSRGMQQKLALAVALVRPAPLLVLDEPTLGLDVESALDIRGMLQSIVKEEGNTILLTTHDMRLVRAICPRVMIINKGRIVTDDSLPNLLNLFEVKSYCLHLQGQINEEQKEALQRLDQVSFRPEQHNGTIMDIHLEHPEKLYTLMDTLQEEGIVVETIQRQEVDLEEVFLQLLNREGGRV